MPGLLLFIAHPDDEIFCSGLLCHLTSQFIPVHIVCLTRGEGGRLGSPPIATKENIGEVREEEMINAVQEIGAASIDFLGYIDPEPDGSRLKAPDHEPEALLRAMSNYITDFNPGVILTHGSTGDYGHPAHVLVHNMALAAAQDQGVPLYTFNAFYPGSGRLGALNRYDWATFVFDSSKYHGKRLEVFWQHKTQWTVFVGERDSEAEYRTALSVYFSTTSTESYCLKYQGNSDKDILREMAGVHASDPPDSSAIARLRYKLTWTFRETAKKIKRKLVG